MPQLYPTGLKIFSEYIAKVICKSGKMMYNNYRKKGE
jgi:hypothetical protein